jgi:hypothetical protein
MIPAGVGAERNTRNVTGQINMPYLILSIIAVSVIGAFYAGTKFTSPVATSLQPTSTPAPTQNVTPTIAMKIYRNDTYGFSFEYPEEFSVEVKNDVEAQFLLSIESAQESYSLDVGPIGNIAGQPGNYPEYPLNRSPQGTKVFGGRVWEVIPSTVFGDAGMVFTTPRYYQVDNGKYRYDFFIGETDTETANFEKIVSSFKYDNDSR